jgi:hypothetical protein
MDLEFTNGKTDPNTKELMLMGKNKETGFSLILLENNTSECGQTVSNKDLGK